MFAFSQTDYREALLGRYDFVSVPVIIPERHTDPLQILATSEHEQLHDVLARQTTHGILLRLGVRYYRKSGEKDDAVYDGIEDLISEGKALHEAFAVFSTICSNRTFLPLIEHLTEEYAMYLRQALSVIPEQIGHLRLARILVYSATIASLSPELPEPVNEPVKCFVNGVNTVRGCQERWKALSDWMAEKGKDDLTSFIRSHAEQCGYTAEETDYPLYFEELDEVLPSLARQCEFYKKESLLVETLASSFGKEVFGNKPKILTVSHLVPVAKEYRDILYPGYQLSTVMIDDFGLSPEEYSEIYKLLHENIHSDLGFQVRVKRNFAKRIESGLRSLNIVADSIPEPRRIIGYYDNDLSINHSKIAFSGEKAIEWMLVCPDLEFYRNNMLETMITLNPQDILKEAPAHLCKRLGILISPVFTYTMPDMNAALKIFSEKGGVAAQMQPFNFMDFIEWRYLKGYSDRKLLFAYKPTSVKGCDLMICKFREQEFPMIRLVGPSTPVGLIRLNEIKIVEAEEMEYEDATEDWINFLRLFWR